MFENRIKKVVSDVDEIVQSNKNAGESCDVFWTKFGVCLDFTTKETNGSVIVIKENEVLEKMEVARKKVKDTIIETEKILREFNLS